MYSWWCCKLPPLLVNVLYGAWYVALMLLVVLLVDKPTADFYYLHG